MAKQFCLRAVGVLSLAVLIVGLIPFVSVGLSAGAVLMGATAPVSVNRALKGDRLPLISDAVNSAVSRAVLQSQQRSQTPTSIPVGCDAAFSPISSPSLAHVYRRCMS
jgi:hypothetical protein